MNNNSFKRDTCLFFVIDPAKVFNKMNSSVWVRHVSSSNQSS